MILKRLSRGNSAAEFVLIIIVAVILALLIQGFVVKPYQIPSGSMLPTIALSQRVLVNRIGNDFSDPHVGEILVFHPPAGAAAQQCGVPVAADQICPAPTSGAASDNFIKRVVAGPGDTIAIRDGHVIRNGVPAKEPFTLPCSGGESCNYPAPIRISAGHWFMMGDNRGMSDDSRFWGPVPRSWIIGGAFATYWPIGRIGFF